ncbi:hypothetical protein [Gloeocapsopsis dulcis]|uniref:hypothetical protein n=1 Tax=Gloeocapsopsis dulcis TaxID=2859516 RepID=UPI0018C46410|nr:hypothetical protein [Gloeocapsopsis dulcis]WNN88985.1 hypothetical protein P0S91_22460 [Gloeocapsopsis dulcis]
MNKKILGFALLLGLLTTLGACDTGGTGGAGDGTAPGTAPQAPATDPAATPSP